MIKAIHLTPETIKKLNIAAIVLAACFVLWRASDAVWLLYSPAVDVPAKASAPIVAKSSGASLSNVELFNLSAQSAEQGETGALMSPQTDLEQLQETRLSIKLNAVMASSIPEKSAAILTINKQQQLHFLGDKLPLRGNISIVEIYDTTVVISNNGAREKVSLDEVDAAKLGVVVTEVAKPVTEKASDLAQLQKHVRFSPVLAGGRLTAIKLSAVDGSEHLETLGLQEGDRITHINGVEIDQLQDETAMAELINNNPTVQLLVERDGETQSISFNKSILNSLR